MKLAHQRELTFFFLFERNFKDYEEGKMALKVIQHCMYTKNCWYIYSERSQAQFFLFYFVTLPIFNLEAIE